MTVPVPRRDPDNVPSRRKIPNALMIPLMAIAIFAACIPLFKVAFPDQPREMVVRSVTPPAFTIEYETEGRRSEPLVMVVTDVEHGQQYILVRHGNGLTMVPRLEAK